MTETFTAVSAELSASSRSGAPIYINASVDGHRIAIHRPRDHAKLIVDVLDSGGRTIHGGLVDPATGDHGETVALELPELDAVRLARRLAHAYKVETRQPGAESKRGRLVIPGRRSA